MKFIIMWREPGENPLDESGAQWSCYVFKTVKERDDMAKDKHLVPKGSKLLLLTVAQPLPGT